MKRVILFLMVFTIALTPMALTSCKPSDKGQKGNNEPTQIVYTENDCPIWWSGTVNQQAIITDAILEFQTKYPEFADKNFIVNSPAVGDRNEYEIAIAGKTAPSILKMDQVYIAALGESGNIVNLADPKFNYGQHKDLFLESCWNAVLYKEKIYAMPFDANTIAFLYNKDLLDKAGKQPPKNYQEIIDTGKAIKALNIDGVRSYTLPFFLDYYNWTTFNYLFWVWRLGGDVLTPDLKKAAFNEQPGVDALNMIIDLVKKEQIVDGTGFFQAEFYNGTVGMMDMGSWHIPTVLGTDKKANFQFAPMPVLKEGVPNYSGLGLATLIVTSEQAGNKNVNLAYKFAEFLSISDKYQIETSKDLYVFPSLKEACKDKFFNEDIYKVFVDQLKIAKARPNVPQWIEIEEIIATAIDEAVSEERTPKEALDAAATRVNQLLAEEK